MPFYHVTLTKVEYRTVTRKGEWGTVDERPWTQKELDDNAKAYNQQDFLEKNPLKKVYGYKPDIADVEPKETKVLEQTLEDIDLPAVIKALNGL